MLLALKADGRVYLAYNIGDTPMADFDRKDFEIADNIPLWKVKNGCIMGADNDLDEADLLRYDGGIFRGELNMYNLLEKIIPSMFEKFSAFKKTDKDGKCGSDFIIAEGGCACHILNSRECEEIDEYCCLGTGYEAASSSLDMTSGQPSIDRIKKAFEAVEAATWNPAYPIALMDTKTQKIQLIER